MLESTATVTATYDEEDRPKVVRDILGRIGDKWSVIVICRLGAGPRRFNELRRVVGGITQRMLSSTLRGLERDGLVSRTVHPSVPPQVEYALTESGLSLLGIVQALARWTDDQVDAIRAARIDYDRRISEFTPASP
ncbi:winged helix-turn-helix transcriptional regulator [Mycolicibacterium hodleri]|uniref:Transcriptional regulator n=1 Tax=Mycolicibacterium hodleri TaxID=49897 RepID=A0A502E761_9MYCO|nr:helix-turn-helix domain-containing protein [Mycolicibacterium hodleri]TPG33558.1 transcriptional regulator [Mycolicibacterium hodleri]